MKDNQNIEETGVLKDSQLDQADGGLKIDDSDVQLSAGDLTGDAPNHPENVKPEGEGRNIWDKAKETAGEAAKEVKDALNPNSGDPTMTRDYR